MWVYKEEKWARERKTSQDQYFGCWKPQPSNIFYVTPKLHQNFNLRATKRKKHEKTQESISSNTGQQSVPTNPRQAIINSKASRLNTNKHATHNIFPLKPIFCHPTSTLAGFKEVLRRSLRFLNLPQVSPDDRADDADDEYSDSEVDDETHPGSRCFSLDVWTLCLFANSIVWSSLAHRRTLHNTARENGHLYTCVFVPTLGCQADGMYRCMQV